MMKAWIAFFFVAASAQATEVYYASWYGFHRGGKVPTEDQARAVILDVSRRVSWMRTWPGGNECERPEVQDVRVADELIIDAKNQYGTKFHCHIPFWTSAAWSVWSNSEYGFLVKGLECVLAWQSLEDASRFADAMRDVLENQNQKAAGVDTEALKRFQPIAADYLSRAQKPDFPELAKKYRAQAAFDFKEKRYADASEAYARALHVAPWWAEGHYNRALLLGERGAYGQAITEMKKFLTLERTGPTAEKAQAKIYVWEVKLKGG